MFCYAVAFNINCISRELIMWTDISNEHPIFIKKVAELSDKKLSKEVVESLKSIHENFLRLNQDAKMLEKDYVHLENHSYPEVKRQLEEDITMFLQYDKEFISLLTDKLLKYDKKDKIWYTLIEHITEEQKYMYRLFKNLLKQL